MALHTNYALEMEIIPRALGNESWKIKVHGVDST